MSVNLSNPTGTLVVKLGGAVLTDPERLRGLARSVAGFEASSPGRLVIVHGGGPIADERLASAGIDCPKHDGLRATPPEAIGLIVECFRDIANVALCAALAGAGLDPVGLTLTDHASLRVEPKRVPGVDLGHVGTPSAQDGSGLRGLLHAGRTPVLCCVGECPGVGWLNVNADEAAGALAECLGAEAVLMLSDVPAVLDGSGSPIGRLDADGCEALIRAGVIRGGMIPKVRAALHASRHAGCPAVIAGWDGDDPINAALGGAGTLVTASAEGVPA
ncbi:MAG: acetylglutamate kinase [Phycisphaerales bacterium JB040]